MTPLEEILVARIRQQGPMPFAAYMQLALYHPVHGYYAGGRVRTGWHGHFLTSPELDPNFGRLWAGGFEQVWELCGSPARFEVTEIGPGEGAFAAGVLDAAGGDFAAALVYRCVERIPEVEERQRARLENRGRVEWVRSVTELPRADSGCVFANEVVDNLPVHVVERRDDALYEVCVGVEEGHLCEVLLPLDHPELEAAVAVAGGALGNGDRVEVALAARSLVQRAASSLEKGAVVVVDYGLDPVGLRDRAGTLVTYSATGADDRVLERPGAKDITAHVNWTFLTAALEEAGLAARGPVPQREVLHALGSRGLDEDLRRTYASAVAEGRGADAVAALSQRQALAALTDPGGLGGFGVLVGTKGIVPPAFLG